MRCVRAVKAMRAVEGSDLRCIALYTPVDRAALFVRQADAKLELRGGEVSGTDEQVLAGALHGAASDLR